MRSLSSLLSEAIRTAGISVAEVARRSGVHRVTLSKCREDGEREPDAGTLARVLDSLGFDVALVGRAKSKKRGSDADR